MKLNDSLIKQFVDTVGNSVPARESRASPVNVFGTIVQNNDELFVRIDGSDILTPFTSTVQTSNGDRVIVSLEDHRATVTGNLSYPALTRLGNFFYKMTEYGLEIGMLDSQGVRTDGYILITNNAVEIRKGPDYQHSVLLARFGIREDGIRGVFLGSDSNTGIWFGINENGVPSGAVFGSFEAEKSIDVFGTHPNNAIVSVSAQNQNEADVSGGELIAKQNGQFGVYDSQHDKWLIYTDANGNYHTPQEIEGNHFYVRQYVEPGLTMIGGILASSSGRIGLRNATSGRERWIIHDDIIDGLFIGGQAHRPVVPTRLYNGTLHPSATIDAWTNVPNLDLSDWMVILVCATVGYTTTDFIFVRQFTANGELHSTATRRIESHSGNYERMIRGAFQVNWDSSAGYALRLSMKNGDGAAPNNDHEKISLLQVWGFVKSYV